jgi:hypothetical protein
MNVAPPMCRPVVQDDGPDPIDVFVGQRVRECRKRLRLSQMAVATRPGRSLEL